MLHATGVGNAEALPTAAVVNWIIKDGVGMVGRILFGWYKGTDLDNNCKFWRLFADVINDVAFFLDLISPMFPELLLPLISFGSILKSLVGVSGGATRAALTEHQARRSNMADVSAKDASQEVAVSLLGLILGYFLTPLIDTDIKTWLCFCLFTSLHLFFNYMAVTSVIMDKLNRQRFDILIDHFQKTSVILSPAEVAKLERIVYSSPKKIELGCSIEQLWPNPVDSYSTVIENLNNSFEDSHFYVHHRSNAHYVILHKNITHNQILEAYYIAAVENNPKMPNFQQFDSSLNRLGWNTQSQLLGPGEWRYEGSKKKRT